MLVLVNKPTGRPAGKVWDDLERLVGPALCELIWREGRQVLEHPRPAGTPATWWKDVRQMEEAAATLRKLLADPMAGWLAAAHVLRPEVSAGEEVDVFFDVLPKLLEQFSGIEEAAALHLGEVAKGRQPDAARHAFMGWLRLVFEENGLPVGTGENSLFPKVLSLALDAFGVSGGRDLIRKRNSRQPKPAPETPSAAAGPESPSSSARGWWGGELPE